MPFADPESVEADRLGVLGGAHHLLEPLMGGDLCTGDGVGRVDDQADRDGSHPAALARWSLSGSRSPAVTAIGSRFSSGG